MLVLDKKQLFIAPQAHQELMRRLLRRSAAKGRRKSRRLSDKNERFFLKIVLEKRLSIGFSAENQKSDLPERKPLLVTKCTIFLQPCQSMHPLFYNILTAENNKNAARE